MNIELSSLNMKVKNPYNVENDVKVDFEYDQKNKNEYLFTFNAYVGFSSVNDYRYLMRIEYLAKIDENIVVDCDLIKKITDYILSELCEIWILIDGIVIKK